LNNWLKFDDVELSDYVDRELEITDKGQVKSTTTNLITVLVNPCFCKEQDILSGYIFFDTCSRTIRFYGKLKGEKSTDLEIRKWNDHMTNILGVEIEREFGIKYSKNRMEDAVLFVAHKRIINLPAMYMESLLYDGQEHISKLLPKYLGAEDTKLNSWIMKHILVGMVKRAFNPGCKFDELMVLTGVQGVGKTTLINCILGLVQPNYGDVVVLGSDNFINEVELKDQLGFVINDMGIPNILTVDKIEEIFSKIYKHWDHAQFIKLLKQFEIDKDEKYETLSLGNKMRIAIAIALSHNAKLLVLDEPMNALDPAIRAEVVELLIEYTRQEDRTILISSHIVTDLEKMCDYIGFMHAGELIIDDEKDNILSNYGILNLAPEEIINIPEGAIVAKKETPYQLKLLVDRKHASNLEGLHPATLEEIFVGIVKGII